MNLALKSGTNALHGALSFYNRDDSRSSNLFASNRLGTSKQPRDYNRFSGTVSGPILRNKTFFMFSYEKLQDDTVEALTTSVPTARMRTGDFSELLPLGVQIYDPATARLVNGVVVRDAFPGNIIPGRPHQPDRAKRARLLSRAKHRRSRRPVTELLHRAAVDLRLQLRDDARSTTSGRRHIAPTADSFVTSAAKSASTSRAT